MYAIRSYYAGGCSGSGTGRAPKRSRRFYANSIEATPETLYTCPVISQKREVSLGMPDEGGKTEKLFRKTGPLPSIVDGLLRTVGDDR